MKKENPMDDLMEDLLGLAAVIIIVLVFYR
jgi:hypothetical protein